MKTFLFVFFIVLILLCFPFRIKCKFSYNVFSNSGFLSLFFYGIKLSLVKIKILPFKVKLRTKNKKFYLSFKDFIKENTFGEVYLNSIFGVTKIKSIKIFSNIQLKNNSFLPYLLTGSLYLIFGVFYSYFSFFKNFYSIKCLNFANSTNTNFVINFTISVQLNLFLIIYCFFVSIFKNIKRIKEIDNGN